MRTNRGDFMKKHDGINMLKGIACIIVVFLHVPFPGLLGKLISFELNFSVPIFFMISGFFAFKKNDFLWYKKKIFHLLIIILLTEFIYGMWSIFTKCVINGETVQNFLIESPIIKNPIKIIICGTIYNGTLWYIYAAMWTWVIYFFLIKNRILRKNRLYLIMIPLLFIQIFVKLYWMNHYDISKYIYLFRNFLVFGFPMTLLGSWIAKNEEKWNYSLKRSITIVIAGVILSFFEYLVAHTFLKVSGMDFHVSTILISIGLFSLALQFPVVKFNPLLYIGEKLYIWIYLSHILVVSILDETVKYVIDYQSLWYLWLRPIVCLLITLIIAKLIDSLKKEKLKYLIFK